MYTLFLFFISLLIIQESNARYPLVRILKDPNAKKIKIINSTDQRLYMRLKPTYVHAPCSLCSDHSNLNDCCNQTKTKTIEIVLQPRQQTDIMLDSLSVGEPKDSANTNTFTDEYLDLKKIVYAKVYTSDRQTYLYITLHHNSCYTFYESGNNLTVTID